MTKPTVRYTAVAELKIGYGTWIWPVDHPSSLVSNKGVATTSPVLKIEAGGKFETENTIYVPETSK